MEEKRICKVEGCGQKHYGWGLCNNHYQRKKRTGTTHIKTSKERIMESMDINKDGCWVWNKCFGRGGYGKTWHDNKAENAHRVSYKIFTGQVPVGIYVLHRCDNPPCVNPDHLFLGTAKDNSADMVDKGRSLVGSRHGRSKLKEHDVLEIRKELKDGRIATDIASEYNVDQSTISLIATRKTWAHI